MYGRCTCADREDAQIIITKRAFDGRALHGLKQLHNINLFVNFMFPRRPTERHLHSFSTAERPVCVPYKRKPIRLNRRAAAPAASATVNVQKITKRAFDGHALHGLKQLRNINLFVNFMFPRRPTARQSPVFFTAERPVCVPYKRKPIRLNRRAAAPAASATVNIQKITKRAFDGHTLHGLKQL